MAPFDPELVPLEHADLFHHGDDGRGLEDEEYDAQKARMIESGTWPFPTQKEDA